MARPNPPSYWSGGTLLLDISKTSVGSDFRKESFHRVTILGGHGRVIVLRVFRPPLGSSGSRWYPPAHHHIATSADPLFTVYVYQRKSVFRGRFLESNDFLRASWIFFFKTVLMEHKNIPEPPEVTNPSRSGLLMAKPLCPT